MIVTTHVNSDQIDMKHVETDRSDMKHVETDRSNTRGKAQTTLNRRRKR
jgi:hypothetical protein